MQSNVSDPSPTTRRLAAIDIGSNSIRLLVAAANADGTYRVLDDEKRTTRLAQGLAQTGRLQDEAIRQSLEALRHMKSIADGYGVERLDIIATSAVREAENRDQFLRLAAERVGVNIEVITSAEEGELSFASASRRFDLKNLNAAVVDLGGGSAELIFAAKGNVETIHSFPIGAVRLTDAVVRNDPPSEADLARLEKRVKKALAEVGEPDFVPHVMIGAGGTFLALANISMRQRGKVFSTVAGYELDRSEVRHILDSLRCLPLRTRRNVPGLNADRADIIVAGLAVIEGLMKWLRVNRLLINDQGVRDGLLLRMIGRVFQSAEPAAVPEGDPLEGVRQFAVACSVDQHHPEHVMGLAVQIFDQLQHQFQLPKEERVLLQAAGLLHEVGYLINYERHHHHSYHLIMHGNIRGMAPRQRELVANIARYHRGARPKRKHENFARLSLAERDAVQRLSAILRLASALDRTHTQRVKGVRCIARKGELLLLVQADEKPDVDLYSVAKEASLFERAFQVNVRVKWEGRTPDMNGNPE